MQRNDFTEFLEDEKFIRWVINPNPESDHYWEKWIASHPERKEDIQIARSFLSSVEYKNEFKPQEGKYSSGLYKLIKLHELEQQKKRFTYVKMWKIAGMAAMVIIAVLVGLRINQPAPVVEVPESSREIVRQTGFGQKSIMKLPDGSTVHLNVGSKISFNQPFDRNERKVFLSGEAFFEVARDKNRPFLIYAGDIITRVYGTSFNVRAYPDEPHVSVSVETGKVGVSATGNQQGLTLQPNEQAIYQNDERTLKQTSYDRLEVMGWREGVVQFKNMPLTRVITKLERVYGVEFLITDPHLKLKEEYTGLYRNASLERILQGISFALGFDFELNENKVTIKPKNE